MPTLVAELAGTGVTDEGSAPSRSGRIDVLVFSPHAGLTMTAPQDVTLDIPRPQIDSLLYGAVAAVQAVAHPPRSPSTTGTRTPPANRPTTAPAPEGDCAPARRQVLCVARGEL
ncbi:hypothetical protein AAG656_12575 [Streptomyces albidoflavus]|uniref:hypothetical protein n=1 Tax=Streptomyces albidoflavus TaxID=1886 RepID=UPI003159B151